MLAYLKHRVHSANSSPTMTPQRPVLIHRQLQHSHAAYNLQVLLKVLLLEDARNKLEKELHIITNQVYDDNKVVLMSSFSTSGFNELTKALDETRQSIDKVSILLKGLKHDSKVCLLPFQKNVVKTIQCQPPDAKGVFYADALRFGYQPHNSNKNNIVETVQMLRAKYTFQWLTGFLNANPVVVQMDKLAAQTSTAGSVNSTLSSNAEKQRIQKCFDDKCQPEAAIVPSAIIRSPQVNSESTPKFMREPGDVVLVQHAKQSSGRQPHFLGPEDQIMCEPEVSVDQSKCSEHSKCSSQLAQPSVETQDKSINETTQETTDCKLPETASRPNQVPIFKIKQGDSDGTLTFACVIATKAELWDFGFVKTDDNARHTQAHGKAEECFSDVRECRSEKSGDDNACVAKTVIMPCDNVENDKYSDSPKKAQTVLANIPEFQVQRFEEHEVIVSHIVSPGNFYIQHADSISKLQAIVAGCEPSSSRAEQICIPVIGACVIAWFPKEEQWCRAQVAKICGISKAEATEEARVDKSIMVEVRRLDYGDIACVTLFNLKELSPEMCNLPLQALQVSMANVFPINGTDWSEEAVDWFKEMVYNRTLYARIFTQAPNVSVELFLERGKLGAMRRGPSLSLRLAQNGHANHSKLKNIGANLRKKNNVQLQLRKQDLEWEKYLISCYTQQINKHTEKTDHSNVFY
ncbi:uncharacterized protein LOC130924312 isoform X2 [Corythoichthys intestinalis]|uniref:uncharacterized protein LOC130924312 isoform X2 n=1 Tax=Corythoichthys intestinalis TaxID=161448 RepID=UPI0025A63EE7|nr:uncharacterized protein LOC130924312 isoform X2 [Corythoichthys intestinalis]XP_057706759.1 uncharacterized protein LOC130924312 isoform X2 [Corythoichthys intestinalis]XP_057706760.1 uncharacterized protein LOC130924312 isoform X2 [Corythoichthys intestinalis]